MSGCLVVTGFEGFLGWHLRVLARAMGWSDAIGVGRREMADPAALAAAVDGADRVVHLAGANRGEPDAVAAGNLEPARALADAIGRCAVPPRTVVYANSVQAGNATPYGEAKAAAAELLAGGSSAVGSHFVDVRLPNVFGEHGRPYYNSVVATFCRTLASGEQPQVHADGKVELLHATDAAALLLDLAAPDGPVPPPLRCTVPDLAHRLTQLAEHYRTGDLPPLADRIDVRLFNTYRSHLLPGRYPIGLNRRADARGDLVETVRAHGGGGQVFVSTTRPGVTRGEHFHLAKVERFVVLRGEAEIRLRRLLHDDVVRFAVSGADPVAVDMPAMWAHDITNTGGDELLTLFWTNEIFDPDRPDTYREPVA